MACDILHIRERRLEERISHYSVVVLFRVPWSACVERLVDAARGRGAAVVFDIDDLVFDPALCPLLPFLADAPRIVRLQYESLAARLQRTFEACDAFVGATPAVVRAAAARGKPAFVYPNLLHPGLVRASERIHRLRPWMQREPIITYMSGSTTHNEDFAVVAGVLAEIMSGRPDVSLLIGGFLDDEALGDLGRFSADRVIRLPFQDWRVQPWSMNLARVNIAPLAAINEFTNAKSALKFFEAGVIGLPTVATPTETFQAAMTHGADGYLADGAEAWRKSILACLDSETARRVGDAARQTALRDHSHAGHRYRLRDILLSVNGRAAKRYDGPPVARPEHFEVEHTPGGARRLFARMARARATFGIIRRARNPAALSRPDLCRTAHLRPEIAEVDPPTNALDTAGAAAERGRAMIQEGGGPAGMQVFSSPQPFGPWCVAEDVRDLPSPASVGWMACDRGRPVLVSPPLEIASARFGSLLACLAVETHAGEAKARLSWRTARERRFSGGAFVEFPVICDGRPHRYRVRLPVEAWRGDGSPIRCLRFDPLNVPGAFRLDFLVLLMDEQSAGSEPG